MDQQAMKKMPERNQRNPAPAAPLPNAFKNRVLGEQGTGANRARGKARGVQRPTLLAEPFPIVPFPFR